MNLPWTVTSFYDEEILLQNLELLEKSNLISKFHLFKTDTQLSILQSSQTLQYILNIIKSEISIAKVENLLQQIALDKLIEYPVCDVLELLLDNRIDNEHVGTYLKYYLKDCLDDEKLSYLWKGLDFFRRKRKKLSDDWIGMIQERRTMFMAPVVAGNYLKKVKDCDRCLTLLAENEDLLLLLNMLYQIDVDKNEPDDDNISEMNSNTGYLIELWNWAEGYLNRKQIECFLPLWLENHSLVYDLEHLKKEASHMNTDNIEIHFKGRVSYIAFLYHQPFPEELDTVREKLVIYAIVHHKRAFLRLVRKHIEIFRNIPTNSVLFHKDFYQKCLNINTMNIKNLMACSDMRCNANVSWELLTSREHTFDELYILYNLS